MQRNKGKCGYCYQQTQIKAQQRHLDKPKAIKLVVEMKCVITPLIKEKWSPDQISRRLKALEKPSVSDETIYRFILTNKSVGGELYKQLRHQSKPYRKRYGKNDYRGIIPYRVDIKERSNIVNEKTRLG